jgi:hypothetical protein
MRQTGKKFNANAPVNVIAPSTNNWNKTGRAGSPLPAAGVDWESTAGTE